MPRVVGVRFRHSGRAYHFDPAGFELRAGDQVIVETARGLELAHISDVPVEMPADRIHQPLKPILRRATADDAHHVELNRKLESEAYLICKEKAKARGLDMQVVDAECAFDGTKLTFFFTAEGRVDFRELVKDLASVFRMRIELRQIGVRDEARMQGGLGICGRELCCCTFLREFAPVSIKMAKEQSLSMNPTKISGACGRLLCCLKYEQEAYEDANSRMPKPGAVVMTRDGQGVIVDTNVLKQTLIVRLDKPGENEVETYPNEEVDILRPTPRCPRAVVNRAVAHGYVPPPPPPPQPKANGQGQGHSRGRGGRREGGGGSGGSGGGGSREETAPRGEPAPAESDDLSGLEG